MIDLLSSSLFYEMAALLVLASVIGLIGSLLRQPLIVSFIIVGIVASPSVLKITSVGDHIELLSKLGISVLLFLIGLKLDLKMIKKLGFVSVLTALGQVFFTTTTGYLIGTALGFDWITSLYIAVGLAFSSTIIIVKLLSDKNEMETLHGRISLGFLIVQDLLVVIAMTVISALGSTSQNGDLSEISMQLFIKASAAITIIFIFMRYIAEPLVKKLSHNDELLAIFSIGWAVLLAAISDQLGFSKELGGLIAGFSLASTNFNDVIEKRLYSLRDFLLLFFFIELGANLEISSLEQNIIPAIILSLLVLIGNPLIVLSIIGGLGYSKKTGFLAGLTVAQISEFSLVFITMGISVGHVNKEALEILILVGLITITLSSYMILYSHQLYSFCEPVLGIFERKSGLIEEEIEDETATL